MSSLRICSSCRGFAPSFAALCPHCGAPASGFGQPGLLDRMGRAIFGLAGGASIAVTLMACYGMPCADDDPECNPCSDPTTDLDEDGYCGVNDCNEEESAINAGAADPLGDGIDQNCDGEDGYADEDSTSE